MAHKAHHWPGLSAPVYLPADIPVEVRLITNRRFRANENGIVLKSNAHTRTTWHDTSNPNTDAEREWRWADNGREGAGVGGYNGIFDDRKVIITQRFDEVVWAAGTGPGNRTSYAFEQAWGAGGDYERQLHIGAAVHGGLIAAKGWSIGALVQHNFWYGKNCPRQARARGAWPRIVRLTQASAAAARAAADGGGTMYPDHMTEAVARDLFGSVKGSDGKTYSFDPRGIVSQAWLEYGKARDRFEPIRLVNVGSQGQKWFQFWGGLTLYQPAGSQVIELVGA